MTDLPDTRVLVEAAKPLPSIGREAIRAKLEHCEPQEIVEASGLLTVPSPVFVTLRILGELRGCIGSLRPLCANLVEETKDRACAAAFEDPRFPPLTLPKNSIRGALASKLATVVEDGGFCCRRLQV